MVWFTQRVLYQENHIQNYLRIEDLSIFIFFKNINLYTILWNFWMVFIFIFMFMCKKGAVSVNLNEFIL